MMKDVIKRLLRESLESVNLSYVNISTKKSDLDTGIYRIYLNGHDVGGFTVESIGNIELDPLHNFNIKERPIYNNSIFFSGGFIINKDKHKQGIGRLTIKEIFKNNPTIDNIFLYAVDWQGAVGFWLNIGGKTLIEQKGLYYIQLNRNNIK